MATKMATPMTVAAVETVVRAMITDRVAAKAPVIASWSGHIPALSSGVTRACPTATCPAGRWDRAAALVAGWERGTHSSVTGQTIGGADDGVAHAGVAARMARPFDDDQLAAWPGLMELPSGAERALQVEPPVDEHTRNAGQPVDAVQ